METKALVYGLQDHFKEHRPSEKLIGKYLSQFNGTPDWLNRDELAIIVEESKDMKDFFKRIAGIADAYIGLQKTAK
jgi:hypothetical protein